MEFQWASQPTHARLFFVYLLVVIGVAIARSIKMARYLRSSSQRKGQVSLELCFIDADTIEKLSILTVFASVLVCTYGAYPTWASYFNNSNSLTGQDALWFRTVPELLQRFSYGLFVSTILFGVSMFFRTRLAKRRVIEAEDRTKN
jgi:hypothetical protein